MTIKTAAPFSAEAWRARLIAILLWSLMAAGFGSAGWVYGVRPIAVMVQDWRLAQDYREVAARVVGSSVALPGGGTHSVIAAQYEIEGKTYHTTRLTLADDSARDEPENAGFASSLGPLANTDAKTTVWVNPNDPTQAVVSRFFLDQAILRRVSLALAFTLLALAGVVAALGALGNFGYYRRFDKQKRSWAVTAAICGVVFALRRLLVDPDASWDDVFLDIVLVLELIAWLFIYVTITLLFERDEDKKKNSGKESDSGTPRPARARRRKD